MLLKDIRSKITNGAIETIGVDPAIVSQFQGAMPEQFTVPELLNFFRLGKDEADMGVYIEQSTLTPSIAILRPILVGRAGDWRVMLGTTWASKGSLTVSELGSALRTEPTALLNEKAPSGWSLILNSIIIFANSEEALDVYRAYSAENHL